MAAAWALIGLVAHCLLALDAGIDFAAGAQVALWHLLGWGATGFAVGRFVERAVEESFASFESTQMASKPGGAAPRQKT